ncbi:putative neurochondrin [Helianthus annuus]|nr:putative neurochondrin [Helianthus annuus]
MGKGSSTEKRQDNQDAYLQLSDHGQHKGNDLLASVRIVGSYLAETPTACNDKVMELLGYMVSVQGEDEQSKKKKKKKKKHACAY